MEHCYYGRLGIREPKTFGIYFMDDLFARIVKKHEQQLLIDQNKLLENFKKNLNDKLHSVEKNIKKMSEEVNSLIAKVDKLKARI